VGGDSSGVHPRSQNGNVSCVDGVGREMPSVMGEPEQLVSNSVKWI